MANVSVDLTNGNKKASEGLKVWLLEKIRTWVNSLLEAEMTEHLQRARYEPLATASGNYRNGHRPRKLNLFGLGCVPLKVPRDRAGTFSSQLLPSRKGQDAELEAMIAECFLAGLEYETSLLLDVTERPDCSPLLLSLLERCAHMLFLTSQSEAPHRRRRRERGAAGCEGSRSVRGGGRMVPYDGPA